MTETHLCSLSIFACTTQKVNCSYDRDTSLQLFNVRKNKPESKLLNIMYAQSREQNMPYWRDTNRVFEEKRPMCCSHKTQLASARFATQKRVGQLVTCSRDVFGLKPFRVLRTVSLVADRSNYSKVSSRLKFYKY